MPNIRYLNQLIQFSRIFTVTLVVLHPSVYCCAGVFYCRKDPIEKSSSDFHEMRGIMTGCPFPSPLIGRAGGILSREVKERERVQGTKRKSYEGNIKREEKKRKNEEEMRSYAVVHGNILQKGKHCTYQLGNRYQLPFIERLPRVRIIPREGLGC